MHINHLRNPFNNAILIQSVRGRGDPGSARSEDVPGPQMMRGVTGLEDIPPRRMFPSLSTIPLALAFISRLSSCLGLLFLKTTFCLFTV